MRHRHLSNSFPRFGNDQNDSNHTPVEQPYFPTGRVVGPENGPPFVGQMNHHMSRHSAPHHRNLEPGSSRANEYHHPSSNVTMEVQPFIPTFPDPPYSHPSITENRSLAPPPTNSYNLPTMEAGPLDHPTDNQGSLKRKRSGSLNSLYAAGGSSSTSSSHLPTIDSQTLPPYRTSLTITEDSTRNVRRRFRYDLEPNPPNHSSHFYQSTPHPPNYPPAPIQHSNGGHWNYYAPSHRRVSPPEVGGSMNQFDVGGSSGGGSVFNRPSQDLHANHNHSRRVQSSYGNNSRYSHYAHGATSSTPPDNFSSRNSRHCSPGGWRNSSYRSGRPRIAVDRFHTEPHNRMGEHENAMMMVDRSSFYGNSRSFSDQYRDLRLDIDNMSYEELLNLEERIGNVSTGLSEDNVSKCLKEKLYYSCGQSYEQASCPICLEEYKNGDNVGTMEKCGHDYHVDCIKKWLLMKKLCPICKTECST